VYARDLEGRTLTLRVGGRLWKYSLVMVDQETSSTWSHHLGEALDGPLEGKRLERLPSVLTDWESWRRLYPEGTVALFERRAGDIRRDYYDRWRLEGFVLGIADGAAARAWEFVRLDREGAVNDAWSGRPVLAVFDRPSRTPRLYERTVSGRVLTFTLGDGGLTDRETGSRWEPLTGEAVAGPLAGHQLGPLPAIVSTRYAWQEFHPRSE
jgi:hypothetical protein